MENRRRLQVKKVHDLLEGHPQGEGPVELHPYREYFPKNAKGMIIGSFPIGKFSNPARRQEIKSHELDFFFGGEKNLLWKLLGLSLGRDLTQVSEIKKMLEEKGLGVGDVIRSCRRKGGGASDSDLYDVTWNRDLIKKLRKHKIQKLYFTSKQVQKWFHKLFPDESFEEVLLISPSAQSARSVSKLAAYQLWKENHPEEKTFGFILEFYRKVFLHLE